jgi:hypothetical protein
VPERLVEIIDDARLAAHVVISLKQIVDYSLYRGRANAQAPRAIRSGIKVWKGGA